VQSSIVDRQNLTATVHRLDLAAPEIASKAKPGQFVMVMTDEQGERIPLTLADWDCMQGTISVVVSEVGKTTGKLASLQKGDWLPHLAGPLGKPAEIGYFGQVACVATGYGIMTIVPLARALTAAGNQVYAVVSAPTKAELLPLDNLAAASHQLTVTTSDGSFGEAGWVLDPLKQLLQQQTIQRVFVVGSLCMMKLVAATTRTAGTKTMVSLNPIMVDGTGMCGACRVSVGGCTKFACVQGPEFDGHQVDWDLLMMRRCTYPLAPDEAVRAYRCQYCGQW
jgi:ferredoxin/flavodoxin---NADP+ reductase